MKTLLLISILVVVALSMPHDGEHDEKFKEKHKKHMECGMQTKKLSECCEMPKPKEDENSECKSENMDDFKSDDLKKKGRAIVCMIDCAFKEKGFIVEKEIKWDKIKEYAVEHKDEAPEFEEVGGKALEFCENKINEKIENFKNSKPKHDHPKGKDGEKKCGMLPLIVTGCIGGYVTRNCPADKWKNTDDCNAIKANATSIEECMSD